MQVFTPRPWIRFARCLLVSSALLAANGCSERPSSPQPAESPGEAPQETPTEDAPAAPAEALAFDREAQRPGGHIAVFVTGNAMGELEDCGCNLRPLGGLARRVDWIRTHESKWTARLVLDTGDLLAEESRLPEERVAQVLERADVIVRAHVRAGYDAHALGDRDLALGLDALRRLTGPGRPALLAANVVSGGDGSPLFQGSAVFQRGELKIGVIGVLGSDFPRRAEQASLHGIRVEDPVEAVKREAKAVREKGAQILLVLAHAKPETMEAIADEVPGLTAVFGSQTPRETQHPMPLGTTYLADGHEKGKHLGLLGLHVAPGATQPVFHDPAGRAVLQKKEAELTKRIASRTEAVGRAEKAGRTGNLEWLKKNLVKLKTELQQARLSLGEMTDAPANASVISWDLIAIDTALPEDAVVRAAVADLLSRHPSLAGKKGPGKGQAPSAP